MSQSDESTPTTSARATRVRGLSGIRIYAREPEVLARWYAERLGLDAGQGCFHSLDEGRSSWGVLQEEGCGESSALASRCVVGYRVDDLSALVDELREAGEELTGPEELDHGTYAWLRDPEGNPIELFEPHSLRR